MCRACCSCGTHWAGTYRQRRRPWSEKESRKAGCLSPRAQAAQLGRMQGLRTSDREPLIAGQSLSSWRKKFWRSAEAADVEGGMEYVYHITYIHRKKTRRISDARFPAVTEALPGRRIRPCFSRCPEGLSARPRAQLQGNQGHYRLPRCLGTSARRPQARGCREGLSEHCGSCPTTVCSKPTVCRKSRFAAS